MPTPILEVGGHRTHASSDRLRRLGFASGDTAAGRGCNALKQNLEAARLNSAPEQGGEKSRKAELYTKVRGYIVKGWIDGSAAGVEDVAAITAKIVKSVLRGGYKKWYNSLR